MKIAIINGNPDVTNNSFEDYLKKLSDILKLYKHEIIVLQLRDMNIRYCTGCWDCWVKTPGKCVAADDSRDVCREFINAAFVLFASPIIMGFTSALLKKAHDKLIPLILPYFELVQGEVHHVARYDKYPLMGLLLEKNKDTDEEDIKIISDIYRRDAINFKTLFCFTGITDAPVEEVAN
ncbi:MAG: NAD(P)H-dependent oxidoreductase, partial [Chloroflexota bacterium]